MSYQSLVSSEIEAESALMYGLLSGDDTYFDRVRKEVTPSDFADSDYADIYKSLLSMRDSGIAAEERNSCWTIGEYLLEHPVRGKKRWSMDEATRLIRGILLSDMPPEALWPGPLAERVARNARERQIKNQLLQAAQESGEAFLNALRDLRTSMDQIDVARSPNVRTVWDGMEQWKEEVAEERAGHLVATGWPKLDAHLGPIRRGELVVVAARTGVGKTFSVISIANAIAERASSNILIMEMEMSNAEVAERVAAQVLDCNPEKLRPQAPDVAINEMREQYPHLDRIMLCDKPCQVSEIPMMIREASVTSECRVVMVDYLGLLTDSMNGARSKYERISEQIRQLKLMARRHRVTVFVVCQMNREAGDGETEPSIDMLRDSGAIEENADRIVLMWRIGPATIKAKIAKNRFGRQGGQVSLAYSDGMQMREIGN